MKYGVCSFSGHAIHKGKGRVLVMPNGTSFLFGTKKSRSYFLKGMNPKQLSWTMTSRILHKKAEAFKSSTINVPKVEKKVKSYVGLSLEELKHKIENTKKETMEMKYNRKNTK
ncbi:large subunit ribosomal protein L24e [Nematocida sp. AWRm77]|nr:large subunit ribosomal protein L24e [Nematocida sp. AWRm77]